MSVRFVILEDHPLVREALAGLLVTHLGDIEFSYQGASVPQALAAINDAGADCIVLDLDLNDGRSPVGNVADLVSTDVPVLIVSALGDPATIRSSLVVGAKGYVSKHVSSDELLVAIQAVLQGDPYTSSEVAAALLADTATSVNLSEQERRAMVLYASGLKMASVARQMGVTYATAHEYIKRVRAKYEKAGSRIPTKTDMYRMARREGLLP